MRQFKSVKREGRKKKRVKRYSIGSRSVFVLVRIKMEKAIRRFGSLKAVVAEKGDAKRILKSVYA